MTDGRGRWAEDGGCLTFKESDVTVVHFLRIAKFASGQRQLDWIVDTLVLNSALSPKGAETRQPMAAPWVKELNDSAL